MSSLDSIKSQVLCGTFGQIWGKCKTEMIRTHRHYTNTNLMSCSASSSCGQNGNMNEYLPWIRGWPRAKRWQATPGVVTAYERHFAGYCRVLFHCLFLWWHYQVVKIHVGSLLRAISSISIECKNHRNVEVKFSSQAQTSLWGPAVSGIRDKNVFN